MKDRNTWGVGSISNHYNYEATFTPSASSFVLTVAFLFTLLVALKLIGVLVKCMASFSTMFPSV